ncbi:MAG: transposase [Clostridia bacterium]|nr:transposase [Clostridia bacterium]
MNLPNRKPTRLKDYDYSSEGAYFITICTHNKQKILCDIVGEGLCALPSIKLTPIGEVAKQELLKIETHYDNVKIDKYVIMPNHIHLIVRITERINPFPTIKYDISNVIGKYKAAVTRNVGNAFMHSKKLWQRSFHDHIIRDKMDYLKIWNYIDTNPQKWNEDCFYI